MTTNNIGRKIKTQCPDGRFEVDCCSCINPEDGEMIIEVSCKTEGADCGSICTISKSHFRFLSETVSDYVEMISGEGENH